MSRDAVLPTWCFQRGETVDISVCALKVAQRPQRGWSNQGGGVLLLKSKTIGGIIACRERTGSLGMVLLAVGRACARMLLYPSVQAPARLCNSSS